MSNERAEPAVVVDARGMVPPEPLERTLEGLDVLGPGDTLLLIIPRQPGPLFDMLDQNGYTYEVSTREDGAFDIRIRQAG
ncbi:DUF2249 domain-containing protein [Nitrogeniibacter mangrovi]|uniref:DUF2249 domain-containing protein n=1 Tax=Nitrogeniibacter mangrovi TaxID=2016596 RepID=A0A6C1B2Z2_9RHOO|nr:DUF2249 domain-containing protein [Nitrogeniibacter mangrovi]QID17208.1 DUF2249 domain-containing protein [Nitrogeniibacter mangrovi]